MQKNAERQVSVMLWSELFKADSEPSMNQIDKYTDTPLWQELTQHLEQTYNIAPKLFYSACTMDKGAWKGWNVKYRKSGKALCTLYPKQGYFTALVNIGPKEADDADQLISLCSTCTQDLYRRTQAGKTGKALALQVTSKEILQDVIALAGLRAGTRKTA